MARARTLNVVAFEISVVNLYKSPIYEYKSQGFYHWYPQTITDVTEDTYKNTKAIKVISPVGETMVKLSYLIS